MIAIGNINASKVYLGSEEISKIYFGSTQIWGGSSPTPVPPYDAEVEYLQSSGTQWIDTGFKNVSGCVFDVQYSILSFSDSDANAVAFGCREAPRYLAAFSNLQRKNIVSDFQNTTSSAINNFRVIYEGDFSTEDIIRIRSNINEAYIYINEIQVLHGTRTTTSAFTLSQSITLFKLNGTSWPLFPVKLYAFGVYKDNNAVIDMIPVRIGTTGYMYDKVSGQLFDNAGTGNFVLRTDKTN